MPKNWRRTEVGMTGGAPLNTGTPVGCVRLPRRSVFLDGLVGLVYLGWSASDVQMRMMGSKWMETDGDGDKVHRDDLHPRHIKQELRNGERMKMFVRPEMSLSHAIDVQRNEGGGKHA